MRRAGAFALAALPFAALAAVLRQVPSAASAFQPMPWWQAVLHAAVLLGLMAAHAACYARWSRGAPRRIELNEGLTRLWFVAFGYLVVAAHRPTGPLYLALALPWAALSFEAHRATVRRRGAYAAVASLANHGLFQVGLALIGLLAIRLGTLSLP